MLRCHNIQLHIHVKMVHFYPYVRPIVSKPHIKCMIMKCFLGATTSKNTDLWLWTLLLATYFGGFGHCCSLCMGLDVITLHLCRKAKATTSNLTGYVALDTTLGVDAKNGLPGPIYRALSLSGTAGRPAEVHANLHAIYNRPQHRMYCCHPIPISRPFHSQVFIYSNVSVIYINYLPESVGSKCFKSHFSRYSSREDILITVKVKTTDAF